MVLLIETWSPACFCVSDCTSCSIVKPDSESRCSIQVSGKASAALCPCNRRASSATNELTIGGFERAMSAITRIRLLGSCRATSIIWSAHASARFRSIVPAAIRAADAAQILDQRQPQHDGNGPQFAQLERRHRLVGRHEAGKALRVDPAVAVRDRLEREVVDARKPGGGPVRQSGKLAAVPLGQVPLGRADLLFDQVEIVEQPFRGGRDAAVCRDRRGQQVANLDQDALVLGQPRQQLVGAARRQPVRDREALAVLLHLIGAEQLRSQRRLLVGVSSRASRRDRSAPGSRAIVRRSSACSRSIRESSSSRRHRSPSHCYLRHRRRRRLPAHTAARSGR